MTTIYAHTIEPSGLSRRDKDHGYEFYSVMRQCSREDGDPHYTSILYFRNTDRSIYGMIDYATFATSQNIRAIAAKLIKEARFRSQFLVDARDHEVLTSKWK